MTFSENTNLLPGGQSASPSKVKELENRIDDLQQTVTSVADSVADLSNTVTTSELNATSASISNATVDNATVGSETVTTVNADTVNTDTLNATDASVTNLTADDIEANSVDADNGYFGSANAQSFTGQGVNITGDITASNKVQGKTVQATEKVVTPALESTQTELKGATTVRGDVYFPENGDKIYGEYLEIEADKVKADIEAETINATSVTAGTVIGEAIAAQGLLVTGNSRFMGEVQARDIVPEPGQTLDITTDTLGADSIEADTVKVNSLTTGTPTGSNQLVGYDNNGNLIPVDAGLDPVSLWQNKSGDLTTIVPKNDKKVEATEITTPTLNADDIIVSNDVTVGGDTAITGTLQVNGDIIQNGSAYETHAEKLYTKKDLIITRDGAVSALSAGDFTGIQAKKYDGTNDGQLVFDNTGEARVGDVGDTEPLMTRDEIANMTAGSLLKWDGTNKKAVCAQSADIIPSDASASNKLATEASAAKMTEILWSVLKALRDGGNLVKGMQYRITDYVTTTTQTDTQSAGHAFDIIVTADSESVLNENARAAIHAGDTYFSDSKLQAWKLKYCLDNDTSRFAWADTVNGKGVIYRMIDEYENDLPYDFKNIQFKRWRVTKYLVNEAKWGTGVSSLNGLINSTPSLRWGNITNDSAEDAIDDNSDTWYSNTTTSVTLTNSNTGWWKVDDEYDMFCLSDGTAKYFYTFSNFTNDTTDVTDSSLLKSVYKNTFGIRRQNSILYLNNNVFVGNYFNSNTVGNNFNSNTVGNNFNSNTVGNDFNYNTVGNNFNYNTVGNNFNYNTVGNYFNSNTVGNDFNYNTVGNYFNYNTVGNYFNSNTVGNYFNSNTVGNNFNSNTVGNDFNSNTVGNNFNYNTVGNDFNYNTVGNYFNSNTVGNYYRFFHIEDWATNLIFNVNGTSTNWVQKYRILAGTAPSSSQVVNVTAGNTIPYNIKQTGANTISISAA